MSAATASKKEESDADAAAHDLAYANGMRAVLLHVEAFEQGSPQWKSKMASLTARAEALAAEARSVRRSIASGSSPISYQEGER